jgi:hypothetical protein
MDKFHCPASFPDILMVNSLSCDSTHKPTREVHERGEFIGHVTIWIGNGREGEERKISLTHPQGLFPYHLPFPNASFLSILDKLHKAGLQENVAPEILDILEMLEKYSVIEILASSE